MVITIVDGNVEPTHEAALIEAYEAATAGDQGPAIVETFLLRGADIGAWRIATVWRSRDDLEAYRASVEVPEAQRIFRSLDAEPRLAIFDVVRRATYA